MTPLELQLEGFTVYRQHTTVDWQGAETALFAVTGPTGAGKSTLLDAITYVLYGKTARLGGKGLGGLISPGADSLFAQLTFRTGRGVYRATRVAQRRSSGVGTEVRIEVADAQAAGCWRQLPESERVKDANEALEEIVGLDYDGFTRAVLLPQGAFDEFLRGDAGLRRQLLASLLGLDRVERIQQLASSRASGFKGQADAHRALLASEYGEVGPEAIKQIEEEVERLSAWVAGEAEATGRLESDLQSWRQSHKLLSEKAALQEKRARLRSTAERVMGLARTVERAKRATTVTPHVERVEESSRRAAEARAAIESRTGELAAAEERLESVRDAAERKRQEGEGQTRELKRQIAALQEAQPLEAVLLERGGSLSMAVEADRSELLDAAAWQALRHAATLIAPFEQAASAHLAAMRQLSQRREQQRQLEEAVSKESDELTALVEKGKGLRERYEAAEAELESARRADLAAALRAGLREGDPCPVCGGVVGQHEVTDHETAGALEAATAARAAADEALAAARREYEAARTALTRRETNLSNAVELTEAAETAVSQAGAALSAAVQALRERGLEPSEGTVDSAGTGPDSAAAYAPDAGRQLRAEVEARQAAALAAHAAAIHDRLAAAGVEPHEGSALAELAERCQDRLQKLETELQALEKEMDAAATQVALANERVKTATDNHAMFLKDEEKAREGLLAAVAAAGFANVEEAAGAALPAAELQAMESEIKAFEQDMAQVERRDVEIAAALVDLPPLPDAPEPLPEQVEHAAQLTRSTETELKRRRQELDDQRQRLGAERGRLEQARAKLQRSVQLRRELKELDDKHALHHQLNTDLHGHRFPEHLLTQVQRVLARRASSILQLVTDGRYDLRLEAGDYLVADAWAGGELRSARTLSGGESFVASLALALALSDTLAGNAALGALFLDEGFGTLDRATLESVTSVLESLTNEGRMVGVITHVPELSARLPARLVVTKEPSGSTVTWDT